MNKHTLEVLEFPRLLAEIAEFAKSAPGRAAVLALAPKPGLTPDRVHHGGYGAAMRLLEAGGEPPPVRFESVEDCLQRVRPIGATLEVEDLARVRDQLQATADARKFLSGNACTEFLALVQLGDRLHDPAAALAQFRRVFDDELQIRDGASAKLAGIRREVNAIERRIRRRLDKLMQLAGDEEIYQDQYVATRNGRFVVPVRRELKNRVKGIIHDQSNSGATLFIEPDATVEDGNERVRLKLEERDEIRRILGMLSDDVRGLTAEIREAHGALTEYDVWLAVGFWARNCKCRFPTVGKELVLTEARHPLLWSQFGRENRTAELVPLNLRLASDCRVLAVTGANTGGKTVVLKTVGLLTLMVHAGLPIPVGEDAVVPAFDAVFADVGDEQSLAHNLSTFSGHVRNISSILAAVPGKRSLVLLDELGSGTDPLEGGALGCAILQHLAAAGALTIATTHLGIIKTWVHATAQMVNASVLFNRETLEPEYVLRLGTPGASHALTIAKKLELPEAVITAAQGFMGTDHKRLESILADIEEEQNSLRIELRDAKETRAKLKREHRELEAETRELREERKRLIRDARQEAAGIVGNTRKEMEKLLRNAGKLHSDQKQEARELRQTLEKRHHSLRDGLAEAAPKESAPSADARDPEPGDRVWVDKLKDHAKLVKVSGKQCLVNFNGMQVQVPRRGVRLADAIPADTEPAPQTTIQRPAAQAPFELNLIGKRVDEALRELERAIDRGLVQGVQQLRVVHGFGTGALRQGIHNYLRDAAGVESFRLGTPTKDPGGQGATLVTLES